MKYNDWLSSLNLNERHDESRYHHHYHPLAEYIIAPVQGYLLHTPPPTILEMNDWCRENLVGYWNIDFYAYFEFEEDSVLFALRWA